MNTKKNSKYSKNIEKFASITSVEKTFKLGIFIFCAVLMIIYAGQLKTRIFIPFFSPNPDT